MEMPLREAVVSDPVDGVQYSFAKEYKGPPVSYELPKAVPINVERIPVAAVVTEVPFPRKMSLPVVRPILAHDALIKKFPKGSELAGSKSVVSPTSVIAFDQSTDDGRRCLSKGSDSGSETTVSPTSVISFEERAVDNHGCQLSGDLSSSGALEFSNGQIVSGELSDVGNCSRTLDCSSISRGNSSELVGEAGSSCTMEFSGSFNKSIQSSCSLRASNCRMESIDFNDINQVDWVSTESVLSMDYPSSRVSSMKVVNERGGDGRRPAVSFLGHESDDAYNEEYSQDEPEILRVKREQPRKGKRGSCYRCKKGNRFTEKEVCLVCDAKYCSNCVLRAMGSMPEGRKCVTCIGFPIDESKRGNLGKCSRMLKRLLDELEIQQNMKAEKCCEANQLPPEYIGVNGKLLSYEELTILQTCSNPPKKLKPGNYWYDKVSGLWGKEGQKPSQIITPHLNVGGPIKPDASNGNTGIFINGREIRKAELRMLQLAGVQCAGNPHFWVNEDGSYQEEGQKNTKGYIWGKAGTKLVCALLSLPVPSKSSTYCGEPENSLTYGSFPGYLEQRTLQKFLLVGYDGSGTSTIYKRAKILYKDVPFSKDEREIIKLKIQSNVYGYLGIILEGRERFEEESLAEMRGRKLSDEADSIGSSSANDKTMYSIGPRLKNFSDWLLKTMVSGTLETIFPAATREYGPLVEELWNDAAIQATYNRKSELEMLPDIAHYFLERAVDILKMDYEPSDMDILHAEGLISTNGLACVDFSFPKSAPNDDGDSADQHNSSLRYQLIRAHARGIGENCKWLEMFEDIGIVIFCVSLSDYDQFTIGENGDPVNKMLLSRKFFESLVTHPTFDQTDFLVLLNKYDLFEEKIERAPLTRCSWFNDFHPVVSRNRSNSHNNINSSPTLGQLGCHYVAVKFKRLFTSLTGRKLYVSMVKGLELDSVDAALRYAREIVKWEEERSNFSLSEYSVYSVEESSFDQ